MKFMAKKISTQTILSEECPTEKEFQKYEVLSLA